MLEITANYLLFLILMDGERDLPTYARNRSNNVNLQRIEDKQRLGSIKN